MEVKTKAHFRQTLLYTTVPIYIYNLIYIHTCICTHKWIKVIFNANFIFNPGYLLNVTTEDSGRQLQLRHQ